MSQQQVCASGWIQAVATFYSSGVPWLCWAAEDHVASLGRETSNCNSNLAPKPLQQFTQKRPLHAHPPKVAPAAKQRISIWRRILLTRSRCCLPCSRDHPCRSLLCRLSHCSPAEGCEAVMTHRHPPSGLCCLVLRRGGHACRVDIMSSQHLPETSRHSMPHNEAAAMHGCKSNHSRCCASNTITLPLTG